jgi:hypothetical protein|uniref:Uncharacterized protein n=1 Tax=Siphoviridae sp. ctMsr1 TaxID=2826264 RepID=A0A8S5LVB5_9CAUD|nr:MAG TPA: hypothetical protein [Siphoviridae sp. ctMsr1]
MLMKDLEGTKIKVRSRLYRYLLVAFWNKKDRDHVYKSASSRERDKWYNSVKREYDNLTIQQLLDELNVQRPEEIKQFRCCGDGTVAELKKLLKGIE